MNLRLLISAAASIAIVSAAAVEPIYHHDFSGNKDVSGKYNAQLYNGASFEKVGDVDVLSLGNGNGYLSFGTATDFGKDIIGSLNGDYAFAFTMMIPETTALGSAGNFIFNFGKSSSEGYAFFGANESRYSITKSNWTGEQTVNAKTQFPKGEWVSVVVCQAGDAASIYLNGTLKQTADISVHPSDLGATPQNWLGRSPYSGDVYLKGAYYADFRIYNCALPQDEITALASDPTIEALNREVFRAQVAEAVAAYHFDFSDVRANVELPADLGSGVKGVWTSSNEALITTAGIVTRPAIGKPDGELTLTLQASKGTASETYTYPATVRALISDADRTDFDLEGIVLKGNLSNLRSDLVLPNETAEGSKIFWKSSDKDYMSDAGKIVRFATPGDGPKEVTLTATAAIGDVKSTRDFTVSIAEDDNCDSYLFVYFPNNNNEHLYYAISGDGYNYTPLNKGQRVMSSDTVAIKKGIRDPHILRGPDGKTFYMVATDMKSSEGWSSNRGIVMYKSTDLINWTHSTVHFPDRFPEWAAVTRVWAPETIWDPDHENTDGSKGAFLVYFSLLTNDGKCPYDKVYYCYANADFTDLATDPEYFYDRGSATIDCDIIFDERDGLYHMVYKNEGSGGICQVTATRLTPEPGEPAGSQWKNPTAQLQQTNVAVEGAGMFRLINSDTWILMYDCYMNGFYQFCASDDLINFHLVAQTKTSGAFTPRHGTVIPLHPEETAALLEKFPPSAQETKLLGARNVNARDDRFVLNGTKASVAVRPGTDFESFDPELYASAGATIEPKGPQDFSAGAVRYTVKNGSNTTTYDVTLAVEANPVLPGFCADPEVMYSHKTGRFYIYPTSDGYSGWGGYAFNAYSSSDLVNWQKESCILDLSTEAVPWATGNAWAPCIEEKFENGTYRYYFYFSGHNPSKNYKTLGCAVSDSPTGPFRDLGEPLVDTNITGGQLIDSDIFTDTDGQTYYYWGNGSLVASKMAPDMRTISDAKVITPSGGNLQTHAFREGVYVFKRNGIYYFLWSVDDTGARNYHVAYGTSTSPMGPIKVADSPVILIQDPDNEIYGTGHNSVLCLPDRDEWYIVYHRINRHYVSSDPGIHREVCIDRMEFNADGTIKPVTPTNRGVDPVDISSYAAGIDNVTVTPADAEVVRSLWYNTAGICLGSKQPTASGLFIRVDIMADGSSRSAKIVR